MKNKEQLKAEITKIIQSSEMWTYVMDSYHKTEINTFVICFENLKNDFYF
jgi:hypothetical protein